MIFSDVDLEHYSGFAVCMVCRVGLRSWTDVCYSDRADSVCSSGDFRFVVFRVGFRSWPELTAFVPLVIKKNKKWIIQDNYWFHMNKEEFDLLRVTK